MIQKKRQRQTHDFEYVKRSCGYTIKTLTRSCGYTIKTLTRSCGYTIKTLTRSCGYTIKTLTRSCGYTITKESRNLNRPWIIELFFLIVWDVYVGMNIIPGASASYMPLAKSFRLSSAVLSRSKLQHIIFINHYFVSASN